MPGPWEVPVVQRRQVAEGTWAFRFDRAGIDLDFRPGQDLFVTLPAHTPGQRDVTHQFAIASSPENPDSVMVAMRMRDTPFKQRALDLRVGDPILLTPPSGGFTLPDDRRIPLVFLAGGIGITPFRSMLKAMLDRGERRDVTLFYSAPDPDSMPFLQELETWAEKLPLRIVPTVTRKAADDWPYNRGRISPDLVQRALPAPTLEKAIVYIAGPPAMVSDMRDLMQAVGADPDRIRVDDFWGY